MALMYTPIAKPLAVGEILTFLIWGALMFGGGWAVATGGVTLVQAFALSSPFALGAFAVTLGRNIDKLDDTTTAGLRTLPAALGRMPARYLAVAALLGQHVATIALVGARLFPATAILAPLITAMFELRQSVTKFLAPRPSDAPPRTQAHQGSMGSTSAPSASWPLWYTAFAAWHAVTFGYWLVLSFVLAWATSSIRVLRAA